MKRNKNTLVRLGAIFLALIFATGFVSCASTSVETSGKESEKFPKLKEGKSPYYDKFVEKFQANPDDESIGEILKNWKASSPDGDYYKSGFSFFYNGAVQPGDYTSLSFPDNIAYVEYPENQDILIYRDCLLSKQGMEMATSFLEKGVKKYPNRIDLWDVLLTINRQYSFYGDLKDALLDFIDVSYKIDKDLDVWYADFNTMVVLPSFQEQDSVTRDMIFKNASAIIDLYPEENSLKYYEEIFTKLAKLYPDDSVIFGELGYVLMFSDLQSSITYLEKAYELDNGNGNALLNLIICLYATNNTEKAKYYSEVIYNSGNANLIKALDNNLQALGVK